jgi:eukaryotic-like serine/threonine-protein kinase
VSTTIDCVKCHTPLPDNSKFCFACGADQTGGGADAATSGQVEGLMRRLQRLVEGKYKLDRMLGKGGMGAVFLAQDLTLDREVAIKVLPPDISQDPHVIKRFQQEAKTAAKLDHTNIIPIYRVESEGGLNYFVMKYIAGTSLEDVLEQQKEPLAADYIQRVLWEAACALGHAHQRAIVHRDVKPANIMFDHDGKVMLTDFGISKALQAASAFTGTGMIIGTPHYMAPEQAKGQPVDGRADQYSLGVVGYRMVTRQLPFSGDSVHTILYKHIFEEAPRTSSIRENVPPHLSEAISRAMAKEPNQRFATMEEFATAVWPDQPVTAGKGGRTAATRGARPKPVVTAETPTEHVSTVAPTTPLPAARPGAKPVARPAERKSRAGLIVGALVVVALGAGGYLVLGRNKPSSGTQTPVNPPQVATQTPPPAAAPVDSSKVTPPAVQTQTKTPPATPRRQTPPPRRQTPPPRTETPPVTTPAEDYGYITVNASGTFAEVYIDNIDVGQTPLINFRVRAGRHTIKLERVGYKSVSETVQVDPNATVRKVYPLIPEG